MRWQTVWFWYTCHLHLCHVTRFQRVEAQLFQTVIAWCHLELPASEVAKSSFHQKTWNTLCSFPLVQSVFFFCWREFQLQHLRKPSAVRACRAVAEQPCWSHMAVFAWWGFTASKMPSNMSQLTFSVNECEFVCVCVCFPAASQKTTRFLSSFPQGKWHSVTKALVCDGEPWSAQTHFVFH